MTYYLAFSVISTILTNLIIAKFGMSISEKFIDDTVLEHGHPNDGGAVRHILASIMKEIDEKFNFFQSLEDYKRLIFLLFPHVLKVFNMKEMTHIPFPSPRSVITFAHFLFSTITRVRLGVIDGQHRLCAYLCLFSGYRPVNSVPEKYGLPSVTQWRKCSESSTEEFLFEGPNHEPGEPLLTGSSLNIVLMIPEVTEGKMSFSQFLLECREKSKEKDIAASSREGKTLVPLMYEKVLPLAIARVRKELESVSFAEFILSHLSDSEIAISGDGRFVLCPFYSKSAEEKEIGNQWIMETEPYKTTFMNLCRFEMTVVLNDVKNGCMISGSIVKPCIVNFDEHFGSAGKTKSSLAHYAEVSQGKKRIDSSLEDSISKLIPPLGTIQSEEWYNEAVWQMGEWWRGERRTNKRTVSTPVFLAINHSFQVARDIIGIPEHASELLLPWLKLHAFKATPTTDRLRSMASLYFDKKDTSDNDIIRELGNMWFFPKSDLRWKGYAFDRFNCEVLFPMVLPDTILGFCRIIGFLSHSVTSLEQFQDLLRNPCGSTWDEESKSQTINLNTVAVVSSPHSGTTDHWFTALYSQFITLFDREFLSLQGRPTTTLLIVILATQHRSHFSTNL